MLMINLCLEMPDEEKPELIRDFKPKLLEMPDEEKLEFSRDFKPK